MYAHQEPTNGTQSTAGYWEMSYCDHCGTAIVAGDECIACRTGRGDLKYTDDHASWRDVYRECGVEAWRP